MPTTILQFAGWWHGRAHTFVQTPWPKGALHQPQSPHKLEIHNRKHLFCSDWQIIIKSWFSLKPSFKLSLQFNICFHGTSFLPGCCPESSTSVRHDRQNLVHIFGNHLPDRCLRLKKLSYITIEWKSRKLIKEIQHLPLYYVSICLYFHACKTQLPLCYAS